VFATGEASSTTTVNQQYFVMATVTHIGDDGGTQSCAAVFRTVVCSTGVVVPNANVLADNRAAAKILCGWMVPRQPARPRSYTRPPEARRGSWHHQLPKLRAVR
jgi:hypothetical protein